MDINYCKEKNNVIVGDLGWHIPEKYQKDYYDGKYTAFSCICGRVLLIKKPLKRDVYSVLCPICDFMGYITTGYSE